MAPIEEFNKNKGLINSLNRTAKVQADSLDYLPSKAQALCIISFFPDPLERTASVMIRDRFDLDPTRACKMICMPFGLAAALEEMERKPRENVVMVGRLYNLSRAEAENRADEGLDRVEPQETAGEAFLRSCLRQAAAGRTVRPQDHYLGCVRLVFYHPHIPS